ALLRAREHLDHLEGGSPLLEAAIGEEVGLAARKEGVARHQLLCGGALDAQLLGAVGLEGGKAPRLPQAFLLDPHEVRGQVDPGGLEAPGALDDLRPEIGVWGLQTAFRDHGPTIPGRMANGRSIRASRRRESGARWPAAAPRTWETPSAASPRIGSRAARPGGSRPAPPTAVPPGRRFPRRR